MRRTPAEALRTAWSRRGPERETAVAVVKTISATLVSYALAIWPLDSQVAVFAPFAALFTVQATIYRSVSHAIRYLAAVIVGVVAAGIIGATLGQTFWTLAFLIVVTVLVGQWRGFAGYGLQIAIVGLFAFAVGGGDEPGFLLDLMLTVLVGALTGLGVNLVLAPQVRFHDAAEAVADVSTAVENLLIDIAERLRGDDPLEHADSWRTRSRDLAGLVDRVHSDLDLGEEAVRFNPRRFAMRPPPFASSRATIIRISAVVDHTESIARALLYANRSDGAGLDEGFLARFLPSFGNLLEPVAHAVAAFGHRAAGQGDGLDEYVNNAYRHHRELVRFVSTSQPEDSLMLADCGSMLLETERLLSELDTRNVQ